jgi:tRNA G46 methylase TrmB
VADIGCGHGASTILMAQAYPNSTFVGSDYHEESIETARQQAEAAGVSDRVKFDVASAQDFPGGPFDLVCNAADLTEDNLNPVGRIFYAASTMLCTPASLSQDVGLALGAQAARPG